MNEAISGFRAGLFNPDLGNEVVEGRIYIERSKLRFLAVGIEQEIPADRLQADWEENEERICFTDSEIPELSIFTVELSILNRPILPQLEELRQEINRAKNLRDMSRRLKLTSCFFLACLLVFWGISWATSAMVRSIAKKVPPQWEQTIGQLSIEELQAETSLNDYSNQVIQLRTLAAPLLTVLPNEGSDVKFYIVNDPEPNAFALPGNFVVVNSGLLNPGRSSGGNPGSTGA